MTSSLIPRAQCAIFAAALLSQTVPLAHAGDDDARRVVLDNGVTLLLLPVAGADHVAVEAFYSVGFMHEPKGMCQAAHLLEHLVCYSATKSHGSHESFDLLSRKGMVNAETLPDLTHYDYMLPASDLDLALSVEAERLTSLRINTAGISEEAPRCYAETDQVERIPQTGMLKHAFMAFAQAWRHHADTALVRGGLNEMSPKALEKFHRATYRSDTLVLVVAGGFDAKQVEQTVRRLFGGIARPATARVAPIDWTKTPGEQRITWDAGMRGLCIAYEPPALPAERLALSIWGAVLGERLATDTELKALADMVMASNPTWNVGELPFFVYMALKPEADMTKARAALESKIDKLFKQKPGITDLMQIRVLAAQMSEPRSADLATIKTQARAVAQHVGGDESRAMMMTIGQSALVSGLRETAYGAALPEAAKGVQAMDGSAFVKLMARRTAKDRRHVVVVVPK